MQENHNQHQALMYEQSNLNARELLGNLLFLPSYYTKNNLMASIYSFKSLLKVAKSEGAVG